MRESKYRVELHYSVKHNDLRIFREDSFFVVPTHNDMPSFERDEQRLLMKYLSRFMRRPSSGL